MKRLVYILLFIYNPVFGQTNAPLLFTVNSGIPTDGLIAYYPFNNNADDESGNNYDGTIQGTVIATTDRFGSSNSAYDFDGSTGRIDVSTFDYSWVNSDFSISFWFYQETLGTSKRILSFSKHASTGSQYIIAYQTSTDIIGLYGTISTSYDPSNSIPATNWYHVVFISDNNVSKIYLNGVLGNTTNDISSIILTGIDSFSIGALPFNNSWTQYFDGKIDDVIIYNRVLTFQEISGLYTFGQ